MPPLAAQGRALYLFEPARVQAANEREALPALGVACAEPRRRLSRLREVWGLDLTPVRRDQADLLLIWWIKASFWFAVSDFVMGVLE